MQILNPKELRKINNMVNEFVNKPNHKLEVDVLKRIHKQISIATNYGNKRNSFNKINKTINLIKDLIDKETEILKIKYLKGIQQPKRCKCGDWVDKNEH